MKKRNRLTDETKKLKKITDQQLISLAGEAAFERGAKYFAADAVGELRELKGKITASVAGTHSYQVTLRHTNR